jgi:hypothetical protein
MEYKVVPFKADIMVGESESRAAQQLADLINRNAREGWKYVRLETLATLVTTPAVPGEKGCFGYGATPGTPASTERTEVYVAVFSSESVVERLSKEEKVTPSKEPKTTQVLVNEAIDDIASRLAPMKKSI